MAASVPESDLDSATANRERSLWLRLASRSFPVMLAILFLGAIPWLGVFGGNDIADPPPPMRTDDERELARLARTCKGDGYTRAVRSYIKAHGAEAAIPFLIHAFGNSCGGCPHRAKIILLEIGAPAVPALIKAALEQKKDVFGTLEETYSELDPAITIPPLLAALKDTKASRREELLSLVGRLGPKAKDLVPALVWILDDDETASLDLQSKVVRALCAIGPDAATAGLAVVRFLKEMKLPNDSRPMRRRSPEETGRFGTAFRDDALLPEVGRLGPKAEGLLDFLMAEIENPKKSSAFDAIAEMGLGASRARPALRAALNKGDRRIRQRACYALWRTGEPLDNVLPLALDDLKKPDAESQVAALKVLADIGPPARKTFPLVLAVTKTAGNHVRNTALEALTKIDPPAAEVIPSLIGLLKDLSPGDLSDIIECIEHFGPDANAAIPRIVELLRDKAWRNEGNVVHNPRPAAFAIREMGTPPAVTVPGLISILADEDWVVQETAALLLGSLGKEASQAVPQLRQMIHQTPRRDAFDHVIDLRDSFAKALFEIDPESKVNQDLIATLLDAEEIQTRLRVAGFFWKAAGQKDRCLHELAAGLSHERVSARELAAELLSQIGPAAVAARPALHEALSDDESTVRAAAKVALIKIGQ